MPKVKIKRNSTTVDMTAMCDVAFLLLTFFMLTTQFKPEEPVQVTTPKSIISQQLPDANVILITVDKDGRVFFSMDGQNERTELINELNSKFNLGLSATQKNNFIVGSSIGMPLNQLGQFLNLPPEQAHAYKQPGIPVNDSTNNELDTWLKYGLNVNNGNQNLKFVIKGDKDAAYPVIKHVLKTLKDNNQNKLSLVTELTGAPKGSPAYAAEQANSNQ